MGRRTTWYLIAQVRLWGDATGGLRVYGYILFGRGGLGTGWRGMGEKITWCFVAHMSFW